MRRMGRMENEKGGQKGAPGGPWAGGLARRRPPLPPGSGSPYRIMMDGGSREREPASQANAGPCHWP